MRRRGKVDANQAEIVAALRRAGASVLSLADLGNGCPDLLVYFDGHHLLEVKDGNQPPSKQALSEDEKDFHRSWRGPISVVRNIDEAFRAIGLEES